MARGPTRERRIQNRSLRTLEVVANHPCNRCVYPNIPAQQLKADKELKRQSPRVTRQSAAETPARRVFDSGISLTARLELGDGTRSTFRTVSAVCIVE